MDTYESRVNKGGIDVYADMISVQFPNLDTSDIKFLGDGWDHVAVETDGAVFRLPKEHKVNKNQKDHVRYEVAALRMLKPKLDVAIPEPKYVSSDFEFFGYPKLEGVIASSVKNDLSTEQMNQYLIDWAKLAASVHNSITPAEAESVGIPLFDLEKHIRQAESIFDIGSLTELQSAFVRQTIENTKKIDLSHRPRVFLHNDFHSDNILLDPKTYRICGVIDWSDMVIGPPECEFGVLEGRDSAIHFEETTNLYRSETGVVINLSLARTLKHLHHLRVYVYQVHRGDTEGAKLSAQRITDWAEESR